MSRFSETWTDAPYQAHSPTSHAAAHSMAGKLGPLQNLVLKYLQSHKDGRTDLQIAADLNLSPSTARPRRIELERAGKVKDSGRYGITTSGRKATIWVAV